MRYHVISAEHGTMIGQLLVTADGDPVARDPDGSRSGVRGPKAPPPRGMSNDQAKSLGIKQDDAREANPKDVVKPPPQVAEAEVDQAELDAGIDDDTAPQETVTIEGLAYRTATMHTPAGVRAVIFVDGDGIEAVRRLRLIWPPSDDFGGMSSGEIQGQALNAMMAAYHGAVRQEPDKSPPKAEYDPRVYYREPSPGTPPVGLSGNPLPGSANP